MEENGLKFYEAIYTARLKRTGALPSEVKLLYGLLEPACVISCRHVVFCEDVRRETYFFRPRNCFN